MLSFWIFRYGSSDKEIIADGDGKRQWISQIRKPQEGVEKIQIFPLSQECRIKQKADRSVISTSLYPVLGVLGTTVANLTKGTGQIQKFGQWDQLLPCPNLGKKILTLSKEKFKYLKEYHGYR